MGAVNFPQVQLPARATRRPLDPCPPRCARRAVPHQRGLRPARPQHRGAVLPDLGELGYVVVESVEARDAAEAILGELRALPGTVRAPADLRAGVIDPDHGLKFTSASPSAASRSGRRSATEEMTAMQARDLMSSNLVVVPPDTPVAAIAELLAARGISAVPVVDGAGKPVGIVTEGDLIRRLADRPRGPLGWFLDMFRDPKPLITPNSPRRMAGWRAT